MPDVKSTYFLLAKAYSLPGTFVPALFKICFFVLFGNFVCVGFIFWFGFGPRGGWVCKINQSDKVNHGCCFLLQKLHIAPQAVTSFAMSTNPSTLIYCTLKLLKFYNVHHFLQLSEFSFILTGNS